MAAGSSRGSPPRTPITATPAAWAVAIAAVTTGPTLPRLTSTPAWLSGTGAAVTGSLAVRPTTRTPLRRPASAAESADGSPMTRMTCGRSRRMPDTS